MYIYAHETNKDKRTSYMYVEFLSCRRAFLPYFAFPLSFIGLEIHPSADLPKEAYLVLYLSLSLFEWNVMLPENVYVWNVCTCM